MTTINFCKRVIEYCFYLLFLFVPLFFLGNTSELFEFNKMWLTFGLTIIIGACWITKMIAEGQVVVRKTPLDLFLGLFLLSQILSTIFSLDAHISLWGYYSRFNGGLFSTIAYIFLYYAFVSNLEVKHAYRILKISLVSGFFTVLWGFPSHFGYDPTCYVFRGALDTNCWTEAFKPTVRVFSTLGQPAWYAAYLDILLPITICYTLLSVVRQKGRDAVVWFVLMLFFYTCLIFANTRAGTYAFIGADIVLWIILFGKHIFPVKSLVKYALIVHIGFAFCSFLFGAPVDSLNRFTLPELSKKMTAHAQTTTATAATPPATTSSSITDSSQIRLIVWKGAIEAWKASPLFGTGVETFAFAYYQHRPIEHNLTSEWDYLYNKAHNEYLNFLTTTGIFGLGTYIAMSVVFLFITARYILKYKPVTETKRQFLLSVGLFCSYLTIIITNFFGFSVVIVNLYLFLIPAFVFLMIEKLNPDVNYTIGGVAHTVKSGRRHHSIGGFGWVFIIIVFFIAGNMILGLFRYWYADTQYALGYNMDRSSAYQQALPLLQEAVNAVPDEPVYKDEFAVNLATMAQAVYAQNDRTTADQMATQAIEYDNQVVTEHPNNVIFWKNRLRIFYSLASGDPQSRQKYLPEALRALQKSRELAPTDAKIAYNLGILLGQAGNLEEGARILDEAVRLKPDYYDAYNALGLMYHQLALEDPNASASAQERIARPEAAQRAISVYQYMQDHFAVNPEFKETLKIWKEQIGR